MLLGNNPNDSLGEEKYLFLDENKKYSSSERYELFKKMSRVESKTWKKNNHLQRLFGDIFFFNFNVFVLFKLYYRVCDPEKSIQYNIKSSTKFKVYLLILTCINFSYLNYRNNIFPRKIYEECYSSLTNKEFIQLYNHVTNPKLKYYKSF